MRPEHRFAAWRARASRLPALARNALADLQALVPPKLRSWYRGQGQLLLATLDGQRLRLSPLRAEASPRITEIELGGLSAVQRKAAVAAALGGLGEAENQRIFLCLPPRRALRRQLSLPVAVSEDLRQAILFELDRQTPFRAEQVYFDYRLIPRSGPTSNRQTLCVELTVVPRTIVDEQVRQAAALGLPLAAAVLEGDVLDQGEECPNFLPSALDAARPERRRRSNRRFLALSVTLLVAAVALPLIMKQRALAALEQSLHATRPTALEAAALREQLSLLAEENNFLVEKRRARPPTLFLIDRLSHLLPDDTWTSLLEIDGRQLHLQGESATPGQLLPLLDSAGFIDSPELRAARSGEGFDLRARLRPAGIGSGTASGVPAP